tara:strand:- start:1065 stop:1325 length:261 start_codon:yes stop_codon:yes gene_type:complete
MACKKCKCKKEPKMEFRHIWDMHTFQCHENEVYMGGYYYEDNGTKKDITLVFTTHQFLNWLEGPETIKEKVEYMKEQLIKYIKEIN